MREQLFLITNQNGQRGFSLRRRSKSLIIGQSITVFSATFLLAICTYLLTIAPDLTWSNFSSDGGELITASVTLGIPHPPGYPTYILLGKLFSFLPIGTIAFRFNLLSAVSASLAAGFAAATALEFTRNTRSARISALATGLIVAFIPLIWSQATVTEVYALNLALIAAFLWALLSQRSAVLTGSLLGLTITTHLTSVMLVPLALLLTKTDRRMRLCAGIILGLAPLLALPALALQQSPVIWGNPTTLNGWIWLVGARLYAANFEILQPFAYVQLLSNWSNTLLNQLAIFGWVFVVIGVAKYPRGSKSLKGILLTAAMIAVFGFAYGPSDSILLLLPIFLLLSPIIAVGLSRIGHWSILIPLALFILNFGNQDLGDDRQIRLTVADLYADLPQEALILTPGDQSIFTLWYFTHVEEQRSDLILVDANLFAFDWYRNRLKQDYPSLKAVDRDNLLRFQARNILERPICILSLQSPANFICYSDLESLDLAEKDSASSTSNIEEKFTIRPVSLSKNLPQKCGTNSSYQSRVV